MTKSEYMANKNIPNCINVKKINPEQPPKS